MALTRDEVLHIARLARLGVTEAEVERFREQLSSLLDHFAVLQELDTSQVPPTAYVIPLQSVFRGDEPAASLSQEEVLANAPQREEGFFRIHAVLEE